MTILVTGATGAIGRLVTAELIARGHRVHTLSRKPATPQPGVRSFGGDLTSPPFDAALWDGVEAQFLFPAWGGPVDAFLAQSRAAGVKQTVVLSSLAAAQEFPRDQHSTTALHHLEIERAVHAAGLDATILRPGSFANNLRQWAPSLRARGVVSVPFPESSQALIHEADIADVAVAALTDHRHRGAVYALTGPESLTQVQQLRTLAQALGRDWTLEKMPVDLFRQSMKAFMTDDIIQMLIDYWSDTETTPEQVRTTVSDVTGRPGRPLRQWALDHRADFT